MHFRGRFPRDTKPNPSDYPGIWRAIVNYISKHIPSIFGVGFRGTRNPIPPIALKFDVAWPITFPNAFHAFSWYVSEGHQWGTQTPTPPIVLKFDVPLSITFLNTFHTFSEEVSEGHETQSLRLPWNLTCLCQLHFWTHSMHFRGRFPRDTKPNPSDCPGIWRAFVNYISEHIPSIFGIEVSEGHETQSLRLPWNLTCLCQLHFWTHSMHFRGRFPRDTKPNPSDCPGIWRAFVNYISEHIPSIFGVGFRGTRNPIPPIALKFDVPWPITFSNAFHAFSW